MIAEHGSADMTGLVRNKRGVALLITLLVTTLLIALIFEFSYGTRVSLQGAVNFRDSQRAYYLARSGVNLIGRFLADSLKRGQPQAYLQQDWEQPPFISIPDAEFMVQWEDEAGKINIANVSTGQPSLARLEKLFGLMQIDLKHLDELRELRAIQLLSDLHALLSDEEFNKIRNYVTVYGGTARGPDMIDVNTASSEVLQSLGISAPAAQMIIEARTQDPFIDKSKLASAYGLDTTTLATLDVTSDTFLVHSYAKVGGYTKQAEAVITRSTGGFAVKYWRIL